MMTHDVSDTDLHAYLDDELDPLHSLAVEAYLARHPSAAAQLMADRRLRTELRLALAPEEALRPVPTEQAATRLANALNRAKWQGWRRSVPLAGLLLACGWLAHEAAILPDVMSVVGVPDYVDVAIEAHRDTSVHPPLYPQIQGYNRRQLLSATAIAMPHLPPDWKVVDVQAYPSQYGPSVEVLVAAPGMGAVSFFATRPGNSAMVEVNSDRVDGVATANWQVGDVAYALVGDTDLPRIERAAEDLTGRF